MFPHVLKFVCVSTRQRSRHSLTHHAPVVVHRKCAIRFDLSSKLSIPLYLLLVLGKVAQRVELGNLHVSKYYTILGWSYPQEGKLLATTKSQVTTPMGDEAN